MIKINILCAVFVVLLLLSYCSRKSNEQEKKNETANISIELKENMIKEDEILREKYAHEISLANTLINKLEEYYSQNNEYPRPVGFIYEDLVQDIQNQSGKVFYYTWLIRHYVLTYELPDGTGLLYFSEVEIWKISEYLP